MKPSGKSAQSFYEIQVQGELDQGWESYIDGLVVRYEPSSKPCVTTLICPVVDQAALRGLLCRLWDLNLALIAVRRVMTDGKEKENG
jgi:hypothetical protein